MSLTCYHASFLTFYTSCYKMRRHFYDLAPACLSGLAVLSILSYHIGFLCQHFFCTSLARGQFSHVIAGIPGSSGGFHSNSEQFHNQLDRSWRRNARLNLNCVSLVSQSFCSFSGSDPRTPHKESEPPGFCSKSQL